MNIMVVSDLHYVSPSPSSRAAGDKNLNFHGIRLLRAAKQAFLDAHGRIDLLLLLGDMIDDNKWPTAEADTRRVADEIASWQVPFIAVRGNHDMPAPAFQDFFARPGLQQVNGYGFVVFLDAVDSRDRATRSACGLSYIRDTSSAYPRLPLVCLQHHPLHPRLPDWTTYCFMPNNTGAIIASYLDAGVLLSVSGHYHPGELLHRISETYFHIAPCLASPPHRFGHIAMDGACPRVNMIELGEGVTNGWTPE